jgi:signal transduction histidine kinase
LAGYRVVQEALTNAVRYGAGTAAVRLEAGDELVVEVRNPRGRLSSVGAGVGLVGMRERVELLGGTLEAGPVGGEWVVTARIPA